MNIKQALSKILHLIFGPANDVDRIEPVVDPPHFGRRQHARCRIGINHIAGDADNRLVDRFQPAVDGGRIARASAHATCQCGAHCDG